LHTRLGEPRQRSLQQLHDIVLQFVDNQSELETLAGMSNASSGIYYDALQQNLSSIFGEGAQEMSNRLLAGSGGVTSAEHAYRIYELAQLADRESLAEPQNWRSLAPDSRFRAEMERFLQDFGHRAVYEAEISNPRWVEDPAFVFGEIERWRKEPVPRPPRHVADSTRQEAERDLRRLARGSLAAWSPDRHGFYEVPKRGIGWPPVTFFWLPPPIRAGRRCFFGRARLWSRRADFSLMALS